MPFSKSTLAGFAALLASVTQVAAHGHVASIVVDGKTYQGLDPSSWEYSPTPPTSIGWFNNATDQGYVAPDAYGTSDIACHKAGKPGLTSAPVAAGGKVSLIWSTWPVSHHGPILNYMAKCDQANCADVTDPSSLSFFKFDTSGLISGSNTGVWATDNLISNNFQYDLTIPSTLAPGNYVLRHEIIALHSAGNVDGAQNYPQCINLQVTGSGTDSPTGESATKFYTENDPGIKFNLYTTFNSYAMPGPAPVSGSGTSSGSTGNSSSSTAAAPSSTTVASSASISIPAASSIPVSTSVSSAAAVITSSPSSPGISAIAPIASAISALPSSILSSAAPVATGTNGSGQTISTAGMTMAQLLDLLKQILEALFQGAEGSAAAKRAVGEVVRRHARDVVRRV